MSTSRRIVALLVVAAALSCHRVAAAEQFDHAAQLGVVEAGERMCLIIPNAKLVPNDVVHIIFPEAPQRHVEAKVTGKKIPVVEKPRRAGDPPKLVASAAKAINELRWKPKFPKLEDIVRTAWAWHTKHPSGYSD